MQINTIIRPVLKINKNLLKYSRDFTQSAWTSTNTRTYDQIGLEGLANTATLLTDSTDLNFQDSAQNASIPDDDKSYICSAFILKDSDTTRFPEVQLVLQGGTTQQIFTQLNTQTGAITNRNTTGTVSSRVEDWGNWWRLVLKVKNNSSGNNIARCRIYPAVTAVFGSAQIAATGSITIDYVQIERNVSKPSFPIETLNSSKIKSIIQPKIKRT